MNALTFFVVQSCELERSQPLGKGERTHFIWTLAHIKNQTKWQRLNLKKKVSALRGN